MAITYFLDHHVSFSKFIDAINVEVLEDYSEADIFVPVTKHNTEVLLLVNNGNIFAGTIKCTEDISWFRTALSEMGIGLNAIIEK